MPASTRRIEAASLASSWTLRFTASKLRQAIKSRFFRVSFLLWRILSVVLQRVSKLRSSTGKGRRPLRCLSRCPSSRSTSSHSLSSNHSRPLPRLSQRLASSTAPSRSTGTHSRCSPAPSSRKLLRAGLAWSRQCWLVLHHSSRKLPRAGLLMFLCLLASLHRSSRHLSHLSHLSSLTGTISLRRSASSARPADPWCDPRPASCPCPPG
jgi:hypothetical protein